MELDDFIGLIYLLIIVVAPTVVGLIKKISSKEDKQPSSASEENLLEFLSGKAVPASTQKTEVKTGAQNKSTSQGRTRHKVKQEQRKRQNTLEEQLLHAKQQKMHVAQNKKREMEKLRRQKSQTAPVSPSTLRHKSRLNLESREQLRLAILHREVLGPPRAYNPYHSRRGFSDRI